MHLALLALSASLAGASSFDPVELAWNRFLIIFEKQYSKEDEPVRRQIFGENVVTIAEVNASDENYELAINEFTDLTPEEFASIYIGGVSPPNKQTSLGTFEAPFGPIPATVDWTKRGAVTSVKNQGECGSCWSFSAAGALEGAAFLAGYPLTSLAEQQFIDCDQVDNGCNGGLMDNAFKFAENTDLCTFKSYPYKARGQRCNASGCDVALTQGVVMGFYDVGHTEEELMRAVMAQPVAIAIEADQVAFQSYSNGILTLQCGSALDHGVLLVGYGTVDGVKYWKVKNSWGPSWGEDGYIRLERGVGAAGGAEGECGIRSDPSVPAVKKSFVADVALEFVEMIADDLPEMIGDASGFMSR